eukprot:TRINITY_DN5032_c0_g1_i2.p1 TRINITY_DN5032_c0_g1~~TRINITY_DN5032_c0_g1_i2.p1  ORF type:complete len:312 (+),score=41.42 TRINITY_DN5032_c0_g1_i2:132-1067(+)
MMLIMRVGAAVVVAVVVLLLVLTNSHTGIRPTISSSSSTLSSSSPSLLRVVSTGATHTVEASSSLDRWLPLPSEDDTSIDPRVDANREKAIEDFPNLQIHGVDYEQSMSNRARGLRTLFQECARGVTKHHEHKHVSTFNRFKQRSAAKVNLFHRSRDDTHPFGHGHRQHSMRSRSTASTLASTYKDGLFPPSLEEEVDVLLTPQNASLDFIIVGPPKAGTSSLRNYLMYHPHICEKPMEVHEFLSYSKYSSQEKWASAMQHYLKAWKYCTSPGSEGPLMLGEKSPCTLASRQAPKVLVSFSPSRMSAGRRG